MVEKMIKERNLKLAYAMGLITFSEYLKYWRQL